ncbi:pentapeptide repeat-containing protein [Nocardiopsis sp. FR26]|uniref:pentapeptide repeat-containing protein n=1 Tax=Nocardiopsis sp. FR26 TaxID=2605987 RepID=UPI001357FF47|nr:hypothetical protein [Nocardiopsis sp. FR26]
MTRDHRLSSVVRPRVWPVDTTTVTALRAHATWLAASRHGEAEIGGVLDFRGADLTGMDLSWTFLWTSGLSHVTLDRADLHRTGLAGAGLDGAEAGGMRTSGDRLAEADLRGARFGNWADGRGTDLRDARLAGPALTGRGRRSRR